MRRTITILLILVACAPIAAQNVETVLNDESQPDREPGVRLRVFWIGAPMQRLARLVPDQTANLDITVADFQFEGNEPFMAEYPGRYIALLSSKLHAEADGTVRLSFQSAAPAELRLNGRPLCQLSRSTPRATVEVSLTAGWHDVEVVASVNEDPPRISLMWQPPGATEMVAIPVGSLSAEAFLFRPTQPGAKRLLEETARPGNAAKVAGLYGALDIATIRAPDAEVPVGGLAVLSDGRLVVAMFDARRLRAPAPQPAPDGELWLYSGASGLPEQVRREKIASGLFEPLGVCVVGSSIYVSQRTEVTRFDYDAPTESWQPKAVATGWETNDFHALSFGLIHSPVGGNHPGYLFMARGTGLGLGRNPPNHGSVWRIDLSKPPGANVEPISGGHRTPNGIAFGPKGAMFVTDNQGEWTPANELNYIQPGHFYGFYHRVGDSAAPSPFQPPSPDRGSVTEAAVWLPQDEIANSPSQPVMIPDGWPFAGQMLVGDVTYGGINRICLEQVDGVWQGAVFRFTQGLEGGVNRLAFAPGGSLFVGGIGGDHASTWAWVNDQDRRTYQGLQRLRPNGRLVFDFDQITATPEGFMVTFTKPIAAEWLRSPEHYSIQQWTYTATSGYGGPKQQLEKLRVREAQPTADQRGVHLKIDGLKTDRVVHFAIDAKSVDNEEIWSAESWYSLRRIPKPVERPVPDWPGGPPRVVFVTGDDEYGSETSMPMIAEIVERHHGMKATVLYAVDSSGRRDVHGNSIPGLEALRDADVAVFFLRFRQLPETQLREITNYIESGRPIIGLRTSTHAFQYASPPLQRYNDGFGKDVLGQKWISHYGHGNTSRAMLRSPAEQQPILRGLAESFWLHSWLYVTKTQSDPLPDDCRVVVEGESIVGPSEYGSIAGVRQPLAWTRELPRAAGKTARVFYTSLGHPRDFESEPPRRLLVNAIYWALGAADRIPSEGSHVPLPSGYDPPDPH